MRRVGGAQRATHGDDSPRGSPAGAVRPGAHVQMGQASPVAPQKAGRVHDASPAVSQPGASPPVFRHRISTYGAVPTYDVGLDAAEEWVWARLQVLRAAHAASLRGGREEEVHAAIHAADDRWLPMHADDAAAMYDVGAERLRDDASHFLLRLAAARDDDVARWLLCGEALLFRARHARLGTHERAAFAADVLAGLPPGPAQGLYALPFEAVPELVARRVVPLANGIVSVGVEHAAAVGEARLAAALGAGLAAAAASLPALRREDARVLEMLDALLAVPDERAPAASLGHGVEAPTAANIDAAVRHFPPCMAAVWAHAAAAGHVRYHGRQQLGLFLKAVGLPLEDAVATWRRLFLPRVPSAEAFNKEYLYNIRHNYGLEGKRANYGPPLCRRVIGGPAPGPGDAHGCPFRSASEERLRAILAGYVDAAGVDAVLGVSRAGDGGCQAACTALLARVTGTPQHETVVMPTQFYEASVRAAAVKR